MALGSLARLTEQGSVTAQPRGDAINVCTPHCQEHKLPFHESMFTDVCSSVEIK